VRKADCREGTFHAAVRATGCEEQSIVIPENLLLIARGAPNGYPFRIQADAQGFRRMPQGAIDGVVRFVIRIEIAHDGDARNRSGTRGLAHAAAHSA
jgi:hypothetical protein